MDSLVDIQVSLLLTFWVVMPLWYLVFMVVVVGFYGSNVGSPGSLRGFAADFSLKMGLNNVLLFYVRGNAIFNV